MMGDKSPACSPLQVEGSGGPGEGVGMLENSTQEEQDSGRFLFDDSGLPVQLQSGLEALRCECSLTDVTLQVQGVDFPCHRVVLAAASQYFK